MRGSARVLLLAALPAACGGGEEPATLVLLVTLDTTRADALGCYGAPGDASPRVDALAREGWLFERCVATSAITPVSHASILTGLWPYEHGLRLFSGWGGYRLSGDVPTLATELRARGYTTAAVHSAFPVSAAFGLERGFDRFESFDADVVRDWTASAEDRARLFRESFQRRSDATIDLALAVLEELEGPLFLWVHLFDPHDPALQPPPEWLRPVPDGVRGQARQDLLYADEVRYQDEQLGRLLDALKAGGRYESAVIAVVGDHGEGLADGAERHGWSKHVVLYEEQLRVPFVLRAPGLDAGRRVAGRVSTVEVMPALLALASGAAPPASLTTPSRPERTAYAEQLSGYERPRPRVLGMRPQDELVHCVYDGPWKLLYRPRAPERSELFDLERDPGELDDRFAREPEVARRLLAELARRDPWVERPFEARADDVDPELTRALVGLGYTGDAEPLPADPGWRWEWACPADGARDDRRAPCPRCGAPRVMVAVGAALPPLRSD